MMKQSQIEPPRDSRRARHATRIAATAVIFTGTIAVAAGCSPTNPYNIEATPTVRAPQASDYPVRWLTTPHLDLNSPDGTFVRAIAESYYVAEAYLAEPGLFPGYHNATRDGMPWPGWSAGARDKTPTTAYMWAARTPYNLEDRAGKPLPLKRGERKVTVCTVASENPNRGYTQIQFIYRPQGTPPPSHQNGPRTSPTDNVFGDWTVVQSLLLIAKYNRGICDHIPGDVSLGFSAQLGPDPGWPTNGASVDTNGRA